MKSISAAFVLAVFSIVYFISCKENKQDMSTPDTNLSKAQLDDISDGFNLMESNCFSCHSAKSEMKELLAPPMAAIKKHYLSKNTTFGAFSNSLTEFVQNPKEETSKMPGAIEKFGIMPKMNFSDEQLSQVAAYLYYTEIEAPEWFEKHYKSEQKRHRKRKNKSTQQTDYKAKGKELAMSTKAVLGKNLLGAIKKNGTASAVGFCNTRAIQLTDSMALALDASIKRVSDQPRNPKNKAEGMALEYIESAKNKLANNKKLDPMVVDVDGKKIGFYPILTSEMCMQCHGTIDTEIKPETQSVLADLYPKDLATGYATNELRGIWMVTMKPNR